MPQYRITYKIQNYNPEVKICRKTTKEDMERTVINSLMKKRINNDNT